MIVYIDRLYIVNVLALPFNWACVDVSIGSGANGTDGDDITVSVCVVFGSCAGIPAALAFITVVVVVSNDGDNGTFDVCSGNGASGTYGANDGTLSGPLRGWVSVDDCWTPDNDGVMLAAVVSPDAAILREKEKIQWKF